MKIRIAFAYLLLSSTLFSQEVILVRGRVSASGTDIIVGQTNQLNTDSGDGGLVFYNPFVTGNGTYTVKSCEPWVQGAQAGTWGCGIYSTTSNLPSTRLCSATSASTRPDGFNLLTLSGCGTLSANTVYWIAEMIPTGDDTELQGRIDNGVVCPGTTLQAQVGSHAGSLPNPATSPSSANNCYTLRATLNCTSCGDFYEMASSFESGTNAATVTASDLTSSAVSTGLTTWFLSTTPATGITYSTSAAMAMPFTQHVGSTSVGTAGSLGISYDLTNTTDKTVTYFFQSVAHKASAAVELKTDITSNGSQIGGFALYIDPTRSSAFAAVVHSGAGLLVTCQGGTTNASSVVSISANTQYHVTLQIDSDVGAQFSVYDSTGATLIGSGSCTASGWTVGMITKLGIGDPITTGTHPANVFLTDNAILDSITATYPLGIGAH